MVEVYKYKRGINDINVAKNMQFILSDEIDTCLSLNACMENRKIYNGMMKTYYYQFIGPKPGGNRKNHTSHEG